MKHAKLRMSMQQGNARYSADPDVSRHQARDRGARQLGLNRV
jgi:hypothetical protein